MANTINDLYLKYVNKVGKTLENDRYFQYLFEMVQAGSNELQHKNQVLHKVVDERWLTTIEESLDAINSIIEKPRRFVTTVEEVVPVSLARKITADSVRHLSMNTQFIASNEAGEIQPTRILNVSTDESYDLYENRFIYHLIQRLVTFIDKRTDVIFWSTGDETRNTLKYQSKVDDAYEEIEYKIEMTIKNRQNFAENDSDNMQVFMRIDRVRRMVMALRMSSFCSLMAGCARVHSPIQRTNLMMKDPNYRTCYKLWQFLESYDEVGYSIDVQDRVLEFDEEYLFQMYSNLITNYTVFKSLLEVDPRKITEAPAKRRKVIKPKFIKKIEEQFVEDYNIPDVEVRKVFLEEVTQAQLDAEAKLEEETQARKQAEEALEEADAQIMALQQQVMTLMQMSQEAEARAADYEESYGELEQQLSAEREARTLAEQEASEILQQIEEVKAEAQQQIDEAKAEAQRQIDETKAEAQRQIDEAKAETQQQIDETKAEAQRQIDENMAQAQAQVDDVCRRAEQIVEETKEKAEQDAAEAKENLEAVRKASEQQVAEAQKAAEEAVRQSRQSKEDAIALIQRQAEKAVEEAKCKALEDVAALRKEKDALETELAKVRRAQLKAEDARARAQAKAEANSLSRYIVNALNERKQKNQKNSDDHSES